MQKLLTPQKEQDSPFHKHLSKFSCLMIGIGGLIGGGIFSVLGVISVFTGPYSYISYIITGVIALITVYSYQKLNLKWCSSGGEYICVKNAFIGTRLQNLGIYIGVLLFFGYITSMALYAYTFSVYFLLLFNIEFNFTLIILIVLILYTIFTVLNLKGIKESARFQNYIVLIKIIILVLFIIFGLTYALKNFNQTMINVGFNQESLGNVNYLGIIIGSSSIIVSYQGFQLIAYGSLEMKDMPGGIKMMKWSVLISMIIYCLVGFTTMAVLGISGLLGEGTINAEVAIARASLKFMGPFGMLIIIIGCLLSTSSALNATILGSSRLAFRMAHDNVFPNFYAKISKNKVPHNSIIIISVLSTILTIITGGALAIAGVAGLIFAQIFFLMNFANLKVRKQTRSNAIIPFIGMVLTLSLWILLLIYSIINIKNDFYVLVSFLCIEGASIFFIYYLNKKNL